MNAAGEPPATMTGEAGPPRPAPVVLALGSNLGDRLANLQGAVDALLRRPASTARPSRRVYETAPVGGRRQPDYLNAVLVAASTLPARAVLARGQAAEAAWHRVRGAAWGPRTLDVDVIAYGDEISGDPGAHAAASRGRTSGPSCWRRGTTSTPTRCFPGTAGSPTCWPRRLP